LQDEYREVTALIKELEALIASPKKVLALIRQNLVDLKSTYGDARRTQITDQARGALTVHDVLPEEDVWVTVRTDGTVGRAAGRLPAGAKAPQFVLEANTHCDLYLISRRGQATRIGVHQLPDGAGAHHADLGGLRRGDEIAAAFTAQKPNGEPLEGYLVLATAKGAIKRINLTDLAAAAQANPNVIKLDESDRLAWAATSNGGGEIMLVTGGGQVIRFAEDEVRPMGLPAGGIAGIKLQGDDQVAGGAVLNADTGGRELALLTSAGFGRRSPLTDFPAKGRGTQGVGAKLAAKSGPIVASLLVKPTDKLLVELSQGEPKPLAAKSIPAASRAAAGKVVLVLGTDQAVSAVLLPEGGVAPEAPKTNGSTLTEKPKRASKKAEELAAPKARVASSAKADGATAKAEPARAKKAPVTQAEPSEAKEEVTGAKPKSGAVRASGAANKAEPATGQTQAPAAKAPPARAEPVPAKGKATAAKAEPVAGKPRATSTQDTAPAKQVKTPATRAAPIAPKARSQATKTEPAAPKAKAPAAKAESVARGTKDAKAPAAAPPEASSQAESAKHARTKKAPQPPPAPAEPDDVVSRRGKPGVLARPAVTDGGQMLLVPPETPPSDPPPKTTRKGTGKQK
ncbi:MAG: DNA gyrase C-terminal beta-propeller domain-containing protein, partial [Nitrososphaerales archaeon]